MKKIIRSFYIDEKIKERARVSAQGKYMSLSMWLREAIRERLALEKAAGSC